MRKPHNLPHELPPEGYIRLAQLVPHIIPVSPATIWRMVRSKKFPAPSKLSPGVTAWDVGAVRSWMAERGAPRGEDEA